MDQNKIINGKNKDGVFKKFLRKAKNASILVCPDLAITSVEQIVNTLNKINEKFELVQKAANEGEYKLFYKELNDLKTIIGCFKEELISLFEKVRSYTSDEDKILDSLKKLKEKFVHEQKIFNDNATALAIIAPRIKDMMKHISIMFDDCEGNLNAGVYVECFEIIEKIDKEINELSEYLNKMPDAPVPALDTTCQ